MKALTEQELINLKGGFTSNLRCADELQDEAGQHMDDPEYDWEDWADRYMDCVENGN